ncbi:beta-galactosidase [Microbacterium sp. LWH12-1.2]|uniref:beta-galactosidase n=1 Tax=Microbacterium sp. LWH12-1.2 TaxID=3135259 RepID=UPI00342A3554
MESGSIRPSETSADITPLAMFRRRLPGIIYGGDYNPEQWSPEIWREDVELMRQARVRLVSVGVFSWAALEVRDGEYDFAWLDEVLDLLAGAKIAVNLATPNAAPPPWLAESHPETLLVDRSGTRMAIGSRGHFCPSSEVYLQKSRRIARALAERYAAHPALAMWHIGNEYHAHCFCDLCDAAFVRWLQTRYGSLDALNDAWGTVFWSQRYSAWAEVHLPQPVRGSVNPARELDFSRFVSDVQSDLVREERALLQAVTPQIPTTTNLLQNYPLGDYRTWTDAWDVVAFDSYPDPGEPSSHVSAALQFDLMRSLGAGQPWMLMEQAPSGVAQWRVNVAKRPGQMRIGSLQAVAHAADAVMFFQWRASRFGHEKFHSAMVPHGGTESRTWREIEALGAELELLHDVAGSTVDAEVAIVWDWENWWAVEGAAHPRNDVDYRALVRTWHAALWSRNIGVDVIGWADDLSDYRAIIVPNQYLLSEDRRAHLDAFVVGGGHVLIGSFSGIVDEYDRVNLPGYAPGLRELIGARVIDFAARPDSERAALRVPGGAGLDASTEYAHRWQDEIVVEAADVLLEFSDGDLAGSPAVLDHRSGQGRVVYLGTDLAPALLDRVIGEFVATAGARAPHPAPRGVEVVERRSSDSSFLFFLNHTAEPQTVLIEIGGLDLLTGRTVEPASTITLDARAAAVLTCPPISKEGSA